MAWFFTPLFTYQITIKLLPVETVFTLFFFYLVASLIDYALVLVLYYLRLIRQVTNATTVYLFILRTLCTLYTSRNGLFFWVGVTDAIVT